MRLLDVGEADGNHDPFLDDVSELDQPCDYVTLSYRWTDESRMFKTTTETIEERRKGVPMKMLPQAMRDAVVLTRVLGLRYLWIDALCIIQDSPSDWEEQSANMAEIYSNSFLSISAHAAMDASSSFITTKDPLALRGCIHPSLLPDHPGLKSVICPHIPDPDEAVKHTILSQRGWTLQEHLLPCRVLHWGPHEVAWECRTMTASERKPIGEELKIDGINIGLLNSSGLRGDWYRMVENYSARSLTKPKDKLPAIGGLAKMFQQKQSSKLEYIAGLWYEQYEAIVGLGWHRDADNDNHMDPVRFSRLSTPPRRIREPSFSWISTDWPVKFAMHEDSSALRAQTYAAKAVRFSLELKGCHIFGELKACSLTVTGYTISWQTYRHRAVINHQDEPHSFSTTETKPPLKPEPEPSSEAQRTFISHNSWTYTFMDTDEVQANSLPEGTLLVHLFCSYLGMPMWRCSAGFSREAMIQNSLILVPIKGHLPHTYQRVGFAQRVFSTSSGPGEQHPSAYSDITASLVNWTLKEITIL